MMGLDLSLGVLATALGSAVLHFLWQGAAIGVIAAIVLVLVDNSKASARYTISCIALASCAVIFLATFAYALVPAGAAGTTIGPLPADFAPSGTPTSPPQAATLPLQLVQGIAGLWIAGVVVLQSRLALQCMMIRRLTLRAVSAPTANWIATFEALKRDLRISPRVRMLRSAAADVPMVAGWVSPVVLVPVSAFASLSPDQLKAVLVHELAHIRRHDHVLNAIQILIETALFFHPVTWWLSNQVRTERENCCDDAAVRSSPHPRIFAEALARLETIRSASPQAALAATGGPLMSRIARIVGTDRPSPHRTTAWRATLAIAAGTVIAASGIAHALSADDEPQDQKALEILRQYAEVAGSEDQRVRYLYDALIFNGSETQQAFDEHLAKINAELDAAIAAGKITHDQAAQRLEAAQRELDVKHHALFAAALHGHDREEAYLAAIRQQFADAVASGHLSREEAHAKMAEAKQRQDLHAKFKAKATEVRDRIHAAIAAGEISPEEGQQKMAEFERDLKIQFEQYEAKKKLAALVESGEVSQQQADEHLAALHHRALAEQQKRAAELAAAKARIGVLKDQHDQLSAEAAQARAAVQRQHQTADSKQRQHEQHLAVIHEHIAHAIDRGAMTPAEAVKMIDQLKQRVESMARQKAELAEHRQAIEMAEVQELVDRGEHVRAEQLYLEHVRRIAEQDARVRERADVAEQRRAIVLAEIQKHVDRGEYALAERLHAEYARRITEQDMEARERAEVEARDKAESERRAAEHQRRIAAYLIDAGIPRAKAQSAMVALERITHGMKGQRKDFKLNERLRGWLVDQGFTNEHIDILVDVARRRVGGTR